MNFLLISVFSIVLFGLIILLWKSKAKRQFLDEENRRIKDQIKLLENEQLKFQLQPHTVKNILSNLRLFAKKLNQGMDTLSDTLDYVLYKGQQNYVSVEEEINFMRQYIKLNDLFIPGIDCITFNDANVNQTSFYYRNMCVPHLITAYFIENAFKHGDTAHHDFLTINVTLNDDEFHLEVINKVISNSASGERKGIGLSNMRKRLEYLSGDQFNVQFGQTDDEFRSQLTIYFRKDGVEHSNS